MDFTKQELIMIGNLISRKKIELYKHLRDNTSQFSERYLKILIDEHEKTYDKVVNLLNEYEGLS